MSNGNSSNPMNVKIFELNYTQIQEHLGECYDANEPLLIVGQPGIGKSMGVHSFCDRRAADDGRDLAEWNFLSSEAKEAVAENGEYSGSPVQRDVLEMKYPVKAGSDKKNREETLARRGAEAAKGKGRVLDNIYLYFDVRLTQRKPEDISGLPHLNGTSYVKWLPPLMMYVMSLRGAVGILFFDEISNVQPLMQSAAYQLVHDRCAGEIAMSPDIYVAAAGNRVGDRSNVFEMAYALKNRFVHATQMPPSIQEWVDWAMGFAVDSRVIAYLQYKASSLCDSVKDVVTKGESAFATPRSWHKVSNLLKVRENHDAARVYRIGCSAVGLGHAQEFKKFIETQLELKIEDYLNNPRLASDLRIDQIWALVSGVAEYVRGDRRLCNKAFDITRHLREDFSVCLLRLIKRIDPTNIHQSMVQYPESQRLSELAPMVVDSLGGV